MKFKNGCLKHYKIILLLVITFFVGSSYVSAGNMCQIIRIEKGKGGGGTRVELYPERITVPVGTCTVWVNLIASEEVQVSFRENVKECVMATEASTGFKELNIKTGETCYITDKLPRGKTASLFWNKPGVYKYTIELPDPKVSAGPQGGYTGKPSATGVIEIK